MNDSRLKVALIQMAPELLDREATTQKLRARIDEAIGQGAKLIVTPEAILPGYPFWLDPTGGARFNDERQKRWFQRYAQAAVSIERGDLQIFCERTLGTKVGLLLGIIERASDRGGHSLYCSLVYIAEGKVKNVHRKLQPTYEERLVWSPGDGHGLRTFPIGNFTLGGLNCWENWMPLPRAALYGQGENLHVAVWPGNVRNTEILTRFLAREGRSYVLSCCGVFLRQNFPDDIFNQNELDPAMPEVLADGGSCIAAPDGSWLVEPVTGGETIVYAELDYDFILRERQNFDPAGHYSRPDVTQLTVSRIRQSTVRFEED